ncbi:MAG: hypothetical protein JHC84_02995 [Solirubrobacteraceae bacterium]|nr:hypothetical protein [Solirubrobacteraceae bacterium]
MEVLLLLGIVWLTLALGVVSLCAAAQRADREAAEQCGETTRRRFRRRRPVSRRRSSVCETPVGARRSRSA